MLWNIDNKLKNYMHSVVIYSVSERIRTLKYNISVQQASLSIFIENIILEVGGEGGELILVRTKRGEFLFKNLRVQCFLSPPSLALSKNHLTKRFILKSTIQK